MDAARGYDETKGAKFTTYAYVAIRNAMSDLWEEHKKSFEREKQKEGMFPIFLNDGKSNWVSTEGSIGEAALSGRGTDVNHEDRVGDQAVHEVTLEKTHGMEKVIEPHAKQGEKAPRKKWNQQLGRWETSLRDCFPIPQKTVY